MKTPAAAHHRARWKENALFFFSALRQYKEIGMLLPSSGTVARRVAAWVPVRSMRLIVEVGSGTGRISRAVHGTMSKDDHLICVEKNAAFCRFLRQTLAVSNVTVLNMAAEDLIQNGHSAIQPGSADCVILSLAPLFGSSKMRSTWAGVCAQLVKENGFVIIQQCVPVIGRHFPSASWRLFSSHWCMDFPPFRVDVLQKCTRPPSQPAL